MTVNLSESLGLGSIVRESLGSKGTWEICVIESGEGSSGYYPAEVLERDGAKAFPAGTRMFANHDGWEDMMNGGDIRRLMGKTTSDATYRDGALWAEAQFSPQWAEWVSEFHDVVGVSISTSGEAEIGTIGEYTGEVITRLENDPYTSVDVVVAPGAGGKFVRMLESATRILGDKTPEKSTVAESSAQTDRKAKENMEEEIKALKSMVEALVAKQDAADAARAQEAAEADAKALAEADKFDAFAAVETVTEAKLSKALHTRVVEAIKAGNHDVDKLVTEAKEIQDSVAAELVESAETPVRIGSATSGVKNVAGLSIFGGAE